MIRNGFRPDAPPASRIGSTGSTHGEIAVDEPGHEADSEQNEHSFESSPPACPAPRRDSLTVPYVRVAPRHRLGTVYPCYGTVHSLSARGCPGRPSS